MSDADKLEIKKRARRRLVGAAALALLAAIVLPMAMDQEPQQSSPDIQISIPDRDAIVSQARPIVSPERPPGEPDVAPAPVEQAPSAAPPSPPVAPVPPKAAATATVEAPAVAAKPAPAPAPVRDDEAERVKALLGGVPPAQVQAAATESFVLQIGAFGDAAKATALAAELKKQGFSAYTEKAGAVTRVRVGPVPARDQAEKLAARLRAQGHNAVLTPR